MAEFRFGMIPNIDFYLFPISFIIANLFTGGTERQKPFLGLDLILGHEKIMFNLLKVDYYQAQYGEYTGHKCND